MTSADLSEVESLLGQILDELKEMNSNLTQIGDNLENQLIEVAQKLEDIDRIRGVGEFTADLRDLQEELKAIRGVGEYTADLHDLKYQLTEVGQKLDEVRGPDGLTDLHDIEQVLMEIASNTSD